jgi:hypothetical protein
MVDVTPDDSLPFPTALENASEAVLRLSNAWGDSNPHKPLEEAVGELEAVKHLQQILSMIVDELSATVYDQVWSRFKSYEATVAGRHIEVNRSTSATVDAELLLSRLTARLSDEFPYASVDKEGEVIPPTRVIGDIVDRVANVAGLHRPSHRWAKASLKTLGIDPDAVMTTTRGRKTVRYLDS